MAAQKGRDLLLKLDQDNKGNFISVAGLRSNHLSFNAEQVDITSQESTGQWRELLAGAGLRSAQIRGSGIFKDGASDGLIRKIFFDSLLVTWQILIPDFAKIQGPFQITALDFSARHDGEVNFDLTLASAGALICTII